MSTLEMRRLEVRPRLVNLAYNIGVERWLPWWGQRVLVVTCRGEIRKGIPTLCDWALECGLCWGGAMAKGAKYYGGGGRTY